MGLPYKIIIHFMLFGIFHVPKSPYQIYPGLRGYPQKPWRFLSAPGDSVTGIVGTRNHLVGSGLQLDEEKNSGLFQGRDSSHSGGEDLSGVWMDWFKILASGKLTVCELERSTIFKFGKSTK